MRHSWIQDAAKEGDLEDVKALLKANPDLASEYVSGWTALYLAAANGHKDVVDVLLAHGARVDDTCNHNNTPLYAAAGAGYRDVVALLLSAGADVTAKGNSPTPLGLAEQRGHTDVVEILRRHGGTRYRGGIHEAAALGDLEEVKTLLNLNPNLISSKDDLGSTPLVSAVCGDVRGFLRGSDKGSRLRVVELLLSNGADVKLRHYSGGKTVLWMAGGDYDLTKLFLAHGADPIAQVSETGSTPLHHAAECGGLKGAELLLENGADVDGATGYRPGTYPSAGTLHTPLYFATRDHPIRDLHRGVASLLREHGGHDSSIPYGGYIGIGGIWHTGPSTPPETKPAPTPPGRSCTVPLLRVSVRSMKGNVSKVGNKYRFQVRVEGDNESNCGLGWSGVTINVPTINSREQYLGTEIQMSSVGCSAPFQHGPGDMIFGFRDDGSFGEKPATCLFMESVREQWPPHERIALEAVLLAPYSRLDLQVRVWSNRPEAGGAFGDPDWKTAKQQKDQQGIPAYAISLTVGPLGELTSVFRGIFGGKFTMQKPMEQVLRLGCVSLIIAGIVALCVSAEIWSPPLMFKGWLLCSMGCALGNHFGADILAELHRSYSGESISTTRR